MGTIEKYQISHPHHLLTTILGVGLSYLSFSTLLCAIEEDLCFCQTQVLLFLDDVGLS